MDKTNLWFLFAVQQTKDDCCADQVVASRIDPLFH